MMHGAPRGFASSCKDVHPVTGVIFRDKLGRKARKALDAQQRTTWAFPPATRKIDSKKRYNRKKQAHARYDDGMGFVLP